MGKGAAGDGCALKSGLYSGASEPAAPMGDCAAGNWDWELEGQDRVEHLLAITRLLDIRDVPASAVGNSRFGNL